MYQAGPIPPGTGPVPTVWGTTLQWIHAPTTRIAALPPILQGLPMQKLAGNGTICIFNGGTIDLWWWPVLICCERKLLLTGRLKTSRTSETTLVSGLVPGSHASATAPESSSRYCKMSKLVTWHDYFSRERKKEVSPPWNPTGSVTNLMKHNKICIDERIVASPNLSGFHVLSY
jgi:hypothetical protein